MQSEKNVPENQVHTAAVGPPAASGADHVAGTTKVSNYFQDQGAEFMYYISRRRTGTKDPNNGDGVG